MGKEFNLVQLQTLTVQLFDSAGVAGMEVNVTRQGILLASGTTNEDGTVVLYSSQ